jgi:hypothetical protein
MLDQQKFLTEEESMAVEASLLTSEEKFLTRITISSLRLLKMIAQDLEVSVDNLTSQQIITWMELDSKVRLEQGKEQGKLKW